MGEWTNTKINRQVEFKFANALQTHVTISTIDGRLTMSVQELREKLRDRFLLPDVRKMFQAMLDFAEKEDK
jgi:hypothetical protein